MSSGTNDKLSKLNQLRLLATSCKNYIDGRIGNIVGTVYDALVEMGTVKADVDEVLLETVMFTNSNMNSAEHTTLTNGDGQISNNLMTAGGFPNATITLGADYKSETFKTYKYVLCTLLTLDNKVQTITVDLNAMLTIPYTKSLVDIDVSYGDCYVRIHKANYKAWSDTTVSDVQLSVNDGYLLRVTGMKNGVLPNG